MIDLRPNRFFCPFDLGTLPETVDEGNQPSAVANPIRSNLLALAICLASSRLADDFPPEASKVDGAAVDDDTWARRGGSTTCCSTTDSDSEPDSDESDDNLACLFPSSAADLSVFGSDVCE
jgi:hypothetical protein